MTTLGNDLLALNEVKFNDVSEKQKAMNKLSATYFELEGSEKQISFAKSLIERKFGENLSKLDDLILTCNKYESDPYYPLHEDLKTKLELWESVKNETSASNIIQKLK